VRYSSRMTLSVAEPLKSAAVTRRPFGAEVFCIAILGLAMTCGCSAPARRSQPQASPAMAAAAMQFAAPPGMAVVYVYMSAASDVQELKKPCCVLIDPDVQRQGTIVALPKGAEDLTARYHSFFHEYGVFDGHYFYGFVKPGDHLLWQTSPITVGEGAYAEFYTTMPLSAQPGGCYFVEAKTEAEWAPLWRRPSGTSLRLVGGSEGRQVISALKLIPPGVPFTQ